MKNVLIIMSMLLSLGMFCTCTNDDILKGNVNHDYII